MGVVVDLARRMPLPRMVQVEQYFDRTAIKDIDGSVRNALSGRAYWTGCGPGCR